jgi:hypothetical protein
MFHAMTTTRISSCRKGNGQIHGRRLCWTVGVELAIDGRPGRAAVLGVPACEQNKGTRSELSRVETSSAMSRRNLKILLSRKGGRR